ncbi:MAG: hypothetical protein LC733_08520 [Actinobacteria bacterium]|nr:hypothetical protein [Actinomycetota bacterium]
MATTDGWADHCTDASLRASLIDERDLPAGYVEDPELGGRVDPENALGRTLTEEEAAEAEELHCSYGRTWVNDESGTLVSAIVFELRSAKAAAEILRGTADRVAEQDHVEFEIPEVADARGLVVGFEAPETGELVAERAMVIFRRGRFHFTVNVISEVADLATARDLASRQEAKAPSGESAPAEPFDASTFVGQMSGTLLFLVALYLLAVAVVARARDPSGSPGAWGVDAGDPSGSPGEGVLEVSGSARDTRMHARARFATQIFGLSLLLPGVVPAFWPGSLVPAGVGLALLCGPPWWLRRRERNRLGGDGPPSHQLFTGRRTGRVTLMFGAGLVLFIAGAMIAALSGVTIARGESVLVPSESGGDDLEIDPMVVAAPGVLVAVILAAGGVGFYRRARRLAALDARELMDRDDRPIVLYLRSFTDDQIKIRSAVTGRRSLIEQLSPRRFDRFEEVLAWELNRTGPVVALNPPGTELAPVGAARATLPNEEWQPIIAQWMSEAALIVVNAPPGETTEGLRWELQKIDAGDLWSKTLFVCPPVRADELRRRWTTFQPLLVELGVGRERLPADPARVLAASTTPAGDWSVAVASERTEWTYGAALRELVGRERRPAPTG